MEGLTLLPPNTADVLLPAHALELSQEVEGFYRQNPEFLRLFDDDFVEQLQKYRDATAYEDIVSPSPDVQRKELEDAFKREMSFFAKVYAASMAMAEAGHEKVTLLFDVDNTLIQPGINIPRPTFPLVIDMLGRRLGDRLEVGLLTTIKPEHLSADAGYFKDIKRFVNADMLISAPLVEKNAEVRRVAQEYPDRGFVYVDDVKSANEVRSGNARGLWVGPEVHDDMVRHARIAA